MADLFGEPEPERPREKAAPRRRAVAPAGDGGPAKAQQPGARRARPRAAPRDPYDPANMSDAEAVEECRRIAKGGRPRPKPGAKRIRLEQRLALLKKIDLGLELVSACANVGVCEAHVRADLALMREVAEAFARASSRIREQALAHALRSKNAAVMDRILAERREIEAELKAAAQPPTATGAGVDALRIQLLEMAQRHGAVELERRIEQAVLDTLAGNPPPAPSWSPRAKLPAPAAAAAEPVSGEPEIIPPPKRRRPEVLDETVPLLASRAPARVRAVDRSDSPWSISHVEGKPESVPEIVEQQCERAQICGQGFLGAASLSREDLGDVGRIGERSKVGYRS